MRKKSILSFILLTVLLLAACTKNPAPAPAPSPNPGTTTPDPTKPGTDTVTTASIVNENAAFEKAIGKTGTWIICLLKDLTFEKDLVLDGKFVNGKKDEKGNDIVQRKIALYTQDANRNVTAKFALTVPKLTINSPEASVQHGTFKGDLYVSQNNFQLVDTAVNGNVYFTTDAAMSTFKMDEKSSVSGKKELKK